MDDFVTNASKFNLGKIVSKAMLQGVFFAISMAWDRAISGTVALFFDEPTSVAALYAQAFVLTGIISLGVAFISCIFKQEEKKPTRIIARIGAK